MLVTRGLERVLADLTAMGYDSRWGVISAADVGAPHQRDRIWILSTDTCGIRRNIRSSDWKKRHLLHDINRDAPQSKSKGNRWECGSSKISSDVANTNEQHRWSKPQQPIDIGGEALHDELSRSSTTQSSSAEMGNSEGTGFTPCLERQGQGQSWGASIGSSQWWQAEPNVGRVADGVAARVDRLKAIGNGQVPLCAATAWRILSD